MLNCNIHGYINLLLAFDANGDLADGRGGQDRINFGSNYWRLSSIREWLNSTDLKVKYSNQLPDKNHVVSGLNPYDSEAGFISITNFTDEEKADIQPVTHKCLLSGIDKSVCSGGTENHKFSTNISDIVQNYNSSYYENVQDMKCVFTGK